MISYIINTLEQPYALFPTQKRFSMLPEHFPETFSQFHPQSLIHPGRGPDEQRILTLSWGLLYRVLADLLEAWDLLSRKWMRFGSYSLSRARKTFVFSWILRARERSSEISCLQFFKTFHFFRAKLQTSLYHPIPLDSKPYKQTNMLDTLFLLSGLFLYVCVVVIVCVFLWFYKRL